MNRKLLNLITFFSLSFTVLFSENWTVLRTKGDTLVMIEKEWLSLRKGQSIAGSNKLKVQKKSMVRLLSPKGNLVTINGPIESLLSNYERNENKKVKTKSVLDELFTQRSIARMNAVRSTDKDIFEREWLDFCSMNTLRKSKIEAYLGLASECKKKKHYNRCIYVLNKLVKVFPESRGIKKIYSEIINDHPLKVSWHIQGTKGGVKKNFKNTETLKHNDSIQFTLESKSESYLVFYLTSKGEKKKTESIMIYPESEPLNKHSIFNSGKTAFPSEDAMYTLDENPGREIFWGINSLGPVNLDTLSRIQKTIETTKEIDEIKKSVLDLLQGSDSVFFIFPIEHQ
jgi:hypothetical protein